MKSMLEEEEEVVVEGMTAVVGEGVGEGMTAVVGEGVGEGMAWDALQWQGCWRSFTKSGSRPVSTDQEGEEWWVWVGWRGWEGVRSGDMVQRMLQQGEKGGEEGGRRRGGGSGCDCSDWQS